MDWYDVLIWPPLTLIQPSPTPENIPRRVGLWLGIFNTCPNHHSWLKFTTSSINFSSLPSTLLLTLTSFTPWSQSIRATPRRYLWSNTSDLRLSSILNGFQINKVKRNEILCSTLPTLVGRRISLPSHKWSKLTKANSAFWTGPEISSDNRPSLLMRLPE